MNEDRNLTLPEDFEIIDIRSLSKFYKPEFLSIQVTRRQFDKFYYLLSPLVRDRYFSKGFYDYKGFPSMSYRGIPLFTKNSQGLWIVEKILDA